MLICLMGQGVTTRVSNCLSIKKEKSKTEEQKFESMCVWIQSQHSISENHLAGSTSKASNRKKKKKNV